MDWGTAAQWAGVAFSAAAFLFSFFSARSKATTDRVARLEERVAGHDRSLIEITGDLEHLPNKDSAHRMELSITEIRGQLGVMAEALKPVSAIADRLQEFLLEQARGPR
jgi:hypothetical protein